MTLSLPIIQSLAPDQSSLTAAGKLLKPKSWVTLAREDAHAVIWGECQGSGANPYRVIVDVAEHGYKCTCPSRKFPCKHSLALMWQFVENPDGFAAGTAPDWVQEWLGRRKRGSAAAEPKFAVPGKNIATALQEPAPTRELSAEDQAKEQARRDKAAQTRKAQTEADVRAGLDELQQWISDQLRGGIASFVEDATSRCRRIAARLVDAKAAGLSSRLDELPARILAQPATARAEAALFELGQIVLLARAWQADPDDADARAGVRQGPNREALLEDAGALRVNSYWEVIAEQIESRRDGLISQTTWLLDIDSATPRFACLVDYFPASTGRRGSAFTPGQRLRAELLFHPSRAPMRAIIAGNEPPADDIATRPVATRALAEPLQAWHHTLQRLPWAQSAPLWLGAGSLRRDPGGRLWWHARDERLSLPLAALKDPGLLLATALDAAVVLWNGQQGELLRTESSLGVCHPHD